MLEIVSNIKRVLVVDDDPQVNYLFSRQLRNAGFLCMSAASVSEAMEQIDRHGVPDIVVLDLQLGDGDGTAVLDYIRQQGENTKVVVVSANAFARHYNTIDYTIDHMLVKPVSPRGLSVFIHELSMV
ncbi:MAG: hypothetical protein OHK0046_23400 [Anaerolineae bacterium]